MVNMPINDNPTQKRGVMHKMKNTSRAIIIIFIILLLLNINMVQNILNSFTLQFTNTIVIILMLLGFILSIFFTASTISGFRSIKSNFIDGNFVLAGVQVILFLLGFTILDSFLSHFKIPDIGFVTRSIFCLGIGTSLPTITDFVYEPILIFISNYKQYKAEIKKKKSNFEKGNMGENSIIHRLKYLENNIELNSKLLNGMVFIYNDVRSQIDHVMINKKGIFLLETKNYNCDFVINNYGEWYRKSNDGKIHPYQSPTDQLLQHNIVIKNIIFSQVKYSIPIFDIFVLANPYNKVYGAEYANVRILKVDNLIEQIVNSGLSDVLYDHQVDEIYEILMQNCEIFKPKLPTISKKLLIKGFEFTDILKFTSGIICIIILIYLSVYTFKTEALKSNSEVPIAELIQSEVKESNLALCVGPHKGSKGTYIYIKDGKKTIVEQIFKEGTEIKFFDNKLLTVSVPNKNIEEYSLENDIIEIQVANEYTEIIYDGNKYRNLNIFKYDYANDKLISKKIKD